MKLLTFILFNAIESNFFYEKTARLSSNSYIINFVFKFLRTRAYQQVFFTYIETFFFGTRVQGKFCISIACKISLSFFSTLFDLLTSTFSFHLAYFCALFFHSAWHLKITIFWSMKRESALPSYTKNKSEISWQVTAITKLGGAI